jgi:hypothetical protein
MACWPECNPWCECVDDVCRPLAPVINAIRLRTLDGRPVKARFGGLGVLEANTNILPAWSTAFLLVACTARKCGRATLPASIR